jgi:hypothetical protein
MLAVLAAKFDIGVDLISHARKGGVVVPGDAESDRGASAKKDAGRLMRTLVPMTADEAAAFGGYAGAALRGAGARSADAAPSGR